MKKIMLVMGLILILGGCQNVEPKNEESDKQTLESPQAEKEHFRWSLIY